MAATASPPRAVRLYARRWAVARRHTPAVGTRCAGHLYAQGADLRSRRTHLIRIIKALKFKRKVMAPLGRMGHDLNHLPARLCHVKSPSLPPPASTGSSLEWMANSIGWLLRPMRGIRNSTNKSTRCSLAAGPWSESSRSAHGRTWENPPTSSAAARALVVQKEQPSSGTIRRVLWRSTRSCRAAISGYWAVAG